MCWNFLCPNKHRIQLEDDLLTQTTHDGRKRKPIKTNMSPQENMKMQLTQQQSFEQETCEKIELLNNRKKKYDKQKKITDENDFISQSMNFDRQNFERYQGNNSGRMKNSATIDKSNYDQGKNYKKMSKTNHNGIRKRLSFNQIKQNTIGGIPKLSNYRNGNQLFQIDDIIQEIQSPPVMTSSKDFHLKTDKFTQNSTNNHQQYFKRLYNQSNQNQQFLFMSTEINKPIFFTFRMKYQIKEPLDYHLTKSRNQTISVIGKPFMINIKLNVLRKVQQNIIIINYGEKPTINQFLNMCQVIIVDDLSSVKFTKMDKIYILTNKLQNFQQINAYLTKMVKYLDYPDRKKITYFFPSYLRMDQISELLYNIFSEEIMKFNASKYVNQFNFQIEYPDDKNKEHGIVVQFREQICTKKLANIYLNQVKPSLAIFGRYPNKFYTPLRQFFSFIKDFPMSDIFLLKKCFRENKNQFFHRVREVRGWDNYILMTNQSQGSKLEKFIPEYSFEKGHEYRIKKQLRQDISMFFERQKKSRDPSTPIQIQWDDNLDQTDIKLARKNSNNIFSKDIRLDSIGNQQFESINMFDNIDDDLTIFKDILQNDLYSSLRSEVDNQRSQYLPANQLVSKISDYYDLQNSFRMNTLERRKMSGET